MTVSFGGRLRRGEFASGLDPNFFFSLQPYSEMVPVHI